MQNAVQTEQDHIQTKFQFLLMGVVAVALSTSIDLPLFSILILFASGKQQQQKPIIIIVINVC